MNPGEKPLTLIVLDTEATILGAREVRYRMIIPFYRSTAEKEKMNILTIGDGLGIDCYVEKGVGGVLYLFALSSA